MNEVNKPRTPLHQRRQLQLPRLIIPPHNKIQTESCKIIRIKESRNVTRLILPDLYNVQKVPTEKRDNSLSTADKKIFVKDTAQLTDALLSGTCALRKRVDTPTCKKRKREEACSPRKKRNT